MATKTTNYGLTKPASADYYDIGIHNGNMDIVDRILKENANSVAAEKTARSAADTALQANIATEVTARKNADTELGNLISSIQVEAEGKENLIKNALAKTTLIDADTLPLSDSADSSKTKKITFANLKSVLKNFFDTQYTNYVHPTGAGNKHIPAGGAANQFLNYSSNGVAVWDSIRSSDIVDNRYGKYSQFISGAACGGVTTQKLIFSAVGNDDWSCLGLASTGRITIPSGVSAVKIYFKGTGTLFTKTITVASLVMYLYKNGVLYETLVADTENDDGWSGNATITRSYYTETRLAVSTSDYFEVYVASVYTTDYQSNLLAGSVFGIEFLK